MNKTEALKRLTSLEDEAKKLRKIIEEPQTLFEKINNYSDVCKELNIEELDEDNFSFLPKEQRKKQLAFHKIQNIIKLFNEDWKINWKDQNQYKYYPYFQIDGSGGLVFDCSHYHYHGFHFGVGFYKDKETSDFCGKKFIKIYKNLL